MRDRVGSSGVSGWHPGARRRHHRVVPILATLLALGVSSFVPLGSHHDAAALGGWCDQTVFSGADGRYINRPETIIQTAAGQDPNALCNFEQENLAAYDAQRGVTWTDDERDRMLSYGRNDARGVVFADLLRVIAEPADARTGTESAAYAWMQQRVKDLKLSQAQASVAEYDKWKQDPCHYTPPAPYTYTPTGCDTGSLTILFSGPPDPPSYEDFVRYGAMKVLGSIYNADGAMAAVQATRTMMAALALGGVTIGVSGVAAAAIQAGVILSSILPYAYAASAAAASAAAIVGIAIGVILCVVIAVVRGIQVSEIAQIPGQLAADVSRAQSTTSDIATMAQNSNDVGVLFAAFLDGSMPDHPDPYFEPAVPTTPSADTPGFVITGGGEDGVRYSRTLSIIDAAGNPATVWLDHGWWVVDPQGDDPPYLTMTLPFFSSDNRMLVARNLGDRFVVTDPTAVATNTGCVKDGCAPQSDLDYYSVPNDQPPIQAAHAVLVGAPLHFTSPPTLVATYDQGDRVDLAATATGGLAGGNVAYRWTISRVDANDPSATVDTVGYGADYPYTFNTGGTYTITLTAADELGQTITWQSSTFVTSVAKPVEVAQMVVRPPGGLVAGNWVEGGSPGELRLTVPGSDDTHFWVDWDNDASWDEEAQGQIVLLNQPDWMDQEGSYLVHIASQTDAGVTAIDNYEVVVQNVRPDVPDVQIQDGDDWVSPTEDSASTALFHEGDTVHARFLLSDPGPEDVLTVTLHWSDGHTQTMTGLSSGTFVGVTHVYDDHVDDPVGLRVDVVDDDGAHAATDGVAYYRVGEIAPTITDVTAPVDADGYVTLSAAYHDLPLDVKSYTIDWGDGSATRSGALPMSLPPDDDSSLWTFSFDHLKATHWYTSNGDYTITLSVTDGVETTTVHQVVPVTDHRPTITNLVSLGTDPGGEGHVSVKVWDLDPADHAAALDVEADWGDGTGEHPVVYNPATGTFDGTHVYAAQGDYQVTIRAYDTQGVSSEPLTGTLRVTDGSPGHLAATPEPLVIGPVVTGRSVTRTVTVTNDGGNITTPGTLTLTGADAARFSLVDDTCTGTPLAPGGTCTVGVAFASTDEGQRDATLVIPDATSSVDTPVDVGAIGVAVVLDGGAVPPVDFGDVDEGTSASHLIGVTNSGGDPVTLGGLGLHAITGTPSGPDSAAKASPLAFDPSPVDGFTIVSTTCGAVLDPAESCTVDVEFSPDDPGPHAAALVFTGGFAASATLTGTGRGDDTPTSTIAPTSTVAPPTTTVGPVTSTSSPEGSTTLPPTTSTTEVTTSTSTTVPQVSTTVRVPSSTTTTPAATSTTLEPPSTSTSDGTTPTSEAPVSPSTSVSPAVSSDATLPGSSSTMVGSGDGHGGSSSGARGPASPGSTPGTSATPSGASLPTTGVASRLGALFATLLAGVGVVLIAAARRRRPVG